MRMRKSENNADYSLSFKRSKLLYIRLLLDYKRSKLLFISLLLDYKSEIVRQRQGVRLRLKSNSHKNENEKLWGI